MGAIACDRDALGTADGGARPDAEAPDAGTGDEQPRTPDGFSDVDTRPADRGAPEPPPDASPPSERGDLPEVRRDVGPDLARDTGPGVRSGLDPARRVASLGDTELGQLCDWGVGTIGGYGAVTYCPGGGGRTNSPSRAACIAGHDRSARCYATVGQMESCLVALSLDPCSQAVLSSPDCLALASCQRP